VKRRIEGLRAVNSYNAMYDRKVSEFGVRPGLTDDEKKNKYPKDAVHPVVRTHPITGRQGIYVCEGYTTRILDIPEEESRELLDLLFALGDKAAIRVPAQMARWRPADVGQLCCPALGLI
jgi:taurine dioxygenase